MMQIWDDFRTSFVSHYGEMTEYPNPNDWLDLMEAYARGYLDGHADGSRFAAEFASEHWRRILASVAATASDNKESSKR